MMERTLKHLTEIPAIQGTLFKRHHALCNGLFALLAMDAIDTGNYHANAEGT